MVAAPLRALMAIVLVGLTLVGSGCSRLGQTQSPAAEAPIAVTAPTGRLQEVAPPPLVRQLAERLEERDPQLEILAPADGALLPAGPWSLKLRLRDWPLADAGPLGLGPHLVVQVDGTTVRRLSHPDELRDLNLPELAPGSHLVTVYAARPWGEAVKAPGASRQIRLHRVAANPQQLPAPGSAQLVLASPDGLAQAEPVLIDWLLFDAPLQNLRESDGRWRLRVTVNGDSFLVDRHAPLWLRGLVNGSNALQLELLDGRGEPLNGPFNSLVREVPIQPGPRPGWLRGSLTPLELDQLSGLAPVDNGGQGKASTRQEATEQGGAVSPEVVSQPPQPGTALPRPAAPESRAGRGAETGTEAQGAGALAAQAPVQAPEPADQPPATHTAPGAASQPETADSAAAEPAGAQAASPGAPPPATRATAQTAPAPAAPEASATPEAVPPTATTNVQEPDATAQTTELPAAETSPTREAASSSQAAAGEPSATEPAAEPRAPAPQEEPQPQAPQTAAVPQAPPTAVEAVPSAPQASGAAPTPSPPAPPAASSPSEERIAPSTGLAGSARQLVNPDGSLVKPQGSGPLARLRERLQR